jgi:hypothetical protein
MVFKRRQLLSTDNHNREEQHNRGNNPQAVSPRNPVNSQVKAVVIPRHYKILCK